MSLHRRQIQQAAREREARILELRLQGVTVAVIAQQCGINQQRVSQLYYRALNRIEKPVADRVRREQLERIDRIEQRLGVSLKVTTRTQPLQRPAKFSRPRHCA